MVQSRLEAAAQEGTLSPCEMHAALWTIARSPCPSSLVTLDLLVDRALLDLAQMPPAGVAACARIVAASELKPGALA